MKSELLLAFNQICAERNLPREVVLEAVRTAIVSAYRRDVGAPSHQNITAQIDLETGRARLFAEKQVVAGVTSPQTEISLEEARKINPRAQLGETMMVDATPSNFGRIAAQAARQRVMQCIREAEREARYAHFAEQEGELVHGVIQSVTPQQVTLHLERTEAILPRKEMVPAERYVLHDRIRVYVMEVRKTPRGPQITVSRSHWKLLRRLLELEVPEIASGVVEIKAITREAGSRSKVAVVARQPGVDPVGACIGMRGMRIQSILRELGNEKVDIIEWSSDPVTFIAKALGPAKVLSVVLDENSTDPLAYVVVPDDQLSLAIGKAGQNARLAAKLTGWRIDIQSATEAAQWGLKQVNEGPDLLHALGPVADLLPQVAAALERHNREKMPYNAEELLAMRQVIERVREYYLALKREQKGRRKRRSAAEEERMARQTAIREARARIPVYAYQISLEELGLSERTQKHLKRHRLTSAGLLMERLAEGEEGLLKLEGIGARVLAEIRESLERLNLPTTLSEGAAPSTEKEPSPAPSVAAEEAIPILPEPMAIPETVTSVAEAIISQPPAIESPIPEPSAPSTGSTPPSPEETITVDEAALEEPEVREEEEGVEKKLARKPSKRHKKPRQEFVYDEELGRAVAIRKHRRRCEDWEDF